jgi:hypothetical protein
MFFNDIYLGISTFGIIFPNLKFLIFIYVIKTFSNYHTNYFKNHFSLSMNIFLEQLIEYYVFLQILILFFYPIEKNYKYLSITKLIYNHIIYNTVLISAWNSKPLCGILFVSIIQSFDSTPFLIALLDNIFSVHYFPYEFFHQKLLTYAIYNILTYYYF